jgi:hypothetical protein
MLIETTATEESFIPSLHGSSDPAWSLKTRNGAIKKERFFVGH